MTQAEALYLFNPKKNQPVIDGTHSLAQVEGSPIARLSKAFLMMEVVAVLPISLLIAAAYSLVLSADFLSNFLVGFVTCTLAALYVVLMGFRMRRKLFGTDGIRGRANTEPMTAEIALRVGMAARLRRCMQLLGQQLGETGAAVAGLHAWCGHRAQLQGLQ